MNVEKVIGMIRRLAGASKRLVSYARKRELYEEHAGPLIQRIPDDDWQRETERFESKNELTKLTNSYKRFVPENALEWQRINDREAGEDEGTLGDNFVRDTKLVKAKTSLGFAAVKTAGIDTLIDILNNNSETADTVLLHEIVSRIEYLGPSLSVKKIRCVLNALAKIDTITQVPEDSIKTMMQSLGEELLCRFHSMTLYSCTCIAESIALIPHAKHEGVLNIISLAFKQNIDEPVDKLTDEQIVNLSLRLLKAYSALDHLLPLVVEAVLKTVACRQASLSTGQRIDVLSLLIPSHMPSILQYAAWLIPISLGELETITAEQCLRFISAAVESGNSSIVELAKKLAKDRVNKVCEDGSVEIKETAVHNHHLSWRVRAITPEAHVLESVKDLMRG